MERDLKEKDIESLILDYLNKRGIFAFKVNTVGIFDPVKKVYRSMGKFTLKGTSDILGIMKGGRFLAIEVKSKRGKVSKEQKAFLYRVNKLGGLGFVARSLEEVRNELDE